MNTPKGTKSRSVPPVLETGQPRQRGCQPSALVGAHLVVLLLVLLVWLLGLTPIFDGVHWIPPCSPPSCSSSVLALTLTTS